MRRTTYGCLWAALVCLVALGSTEALAQSKMSGREMATKAEAMVTEMRQGREMAEATLRKARADKDAAMIDCVNESLVAMKGLLRIAEDYQYELGADLKLGADSPAVNSSFIKIQMAYRKFEEAVSRAKSCGGKPEGGVADGKPVITRSEDPDLPNMDPLDTLENQSIFVDRPPVASPYN